MDNASAMTRPVHSDSAAAKADSPWPVSNSRRTWGRWPATADCNARCKVALRRGKRKNRRCMVLVPHEKESRRAKG
ncbi:MAG TPA: hypothetical protein VGI11_16960, partial [Variovorax sp.]